MLFVGVLATLCAVAQTTWYNPVEAGFPVIQGQGWPTEVRQNPYHRFPARVNGTVRKAVWGLSTDCAGESIEFTTNATNITVRYTVAYGHAMAHMPKTGVTGVDLYTRTRHGDEIWVAGRYSFKDTVTYTYGPVNFDNSAKHEHTYTLFLPPYNSVKWLEIGVDEGSKFRFEPLREEKPIVAYGTSIGQGACASRPGMIWSNILQRRMDRTVMNFGFSGNAFFEKEVINLLGEIDAKVYILDALPNSHTMPYEQLRDTIMAAVYRLRSVRPTTPILLADHLGYPHGKAIEYWRNQERHANAAQKAAYDSLCAEGVEHIYHLTYDEIALPMDATVEAIHASDYGMKVYADAYERELRAILDEEVGDKTTMRPVRQSRDFYDWNERHRRKLVESRGQHYPLVLIGNSIVHQWGGEPGFRIQRGADVWNEKLKGVLNLGYGWDRIENVLWRLYHDEVDYFTADRIVLMIGTNNLPYTSDEDIVDGLRLLLQQLAERRPEAELTMLGVLPRHNLEKRVADLNRKIARMARELGVKYADPGRNLLGKGGKIIDSMFVDGLHPSAAGYAAIVDGIAQ